MCRRRHSTASRPEADDSCHIPLEKRARRLTNPSRRRKTRKPVAGLRVKCFFARDADLSANRNESTRHRRFFGENATTVVADRQKSVARRTQQARNHFRHLAIRPCGRAPSDPSKPPCGTSNRFAPSLPDRRRVWENPCPCRFAVPTARIVGREARVCRRVVPVYFKQQCPFIIRRFPLLIKREELNAADGSRRTSPRSMAV